jgi:hypothetical protein
MSEISVDWKSHILVEYSKNKFACELMNGQLHDDRYWIIDEIIYYKGRIYLVTESLFKKRVLKAFHDSSLVRHHGFLKAYRKIRERFAWKGPKGYLMCHIRECTTLKQNKDEHIHPIGLLQHLPIPKRKWESVFMDFIIGLPKPEGKDCIFVVVDRLTKFSHFFSISMVLSASQVADLFFREVFQVAWITQNDCE